MRNFAATGPWKAPTTRAWRIELRMQSPTRQPESQVVSRFGHIVLLKIVLHIPILSLRYKSSNSIDFQTLPHLIHESSLTSNSRWDQQRDSRRACVLKLRHTSVATLEPCGLRASNVGHIASGHGNTNQLEISIASVCNNKHYFEH